MTVTVKMDKELVRAVRDAIAADVEKFEMSAWFSGPGCYTEMPAAKRLDGCGTAGCFAGHTVVEYAKLHNVTWTVYGDFVKLPLSGHSEPVSDVARRLLSGGQGSEAWTTLFNTAGWPQHYRDMVVAGASSHEAQAKAVVELLDDILDEITVWQETVVHSAPCEPGCPLCLREKYVVKAWVYLPGEAEANADA